MSISTLLFRIYSYWRYFIHAQNNAYIHSPFIFDFYNHVLQSGTPVDLEIDKYEAYLASNQTLINIESIGAKKVGSPNYSSTIASHFQRTKTAKKEGTILYRIASHYAIQNAIELGTSLGVSALYIAKGNEQIRLKTIDYNRETSNVLAQYLKEKQIENIELFQGTFEEHLAHVAAACAPIQLAYIDGDHSYEATIKNVETISRHLDDTFFIVLDDIRWSKGMWAAWEALIKDPQYNYTIDIGDIGILIRSNNHAPKQHFYLK